MMDLASPHKVRNNLDHPRQFIGLVGFPYLQPVGDHEEGQHTFQPFIPVEVVPRLFRLGFLSNVITARFLI